MKRVEIHHMDGLMELSLMEDVIVLIERQGRVLSC